MRRFRRTLDALAVDELYLHGRWYTWSNERRRPTMERIDRAFATVQWLEAFPCHRLWALSTDTSDHAPLLLELRTDFRVSRRFRFEPFWVKLDGYDDVVKQAWDQSTGDVDACRALDVKLRRTARALQSWSMRHLGSVRQQLFMAREIIAQLDKAQEHRQLTDGEREYRATLKGRCLGLASLSRTIARHRSRIRFLGEGDANTKFFHLQACHRRRKNFIPTVQHDGAGFSAEAAKQDVIYNYFNGILGVPFQREHTLNLQSLLPQIDLAGIDSCFSEEEVGPRSRICLRTVPRDLTASPEFFTRLPGRQSFF